MAPSMPGIQAFGSAYLNHARNLSPLARLRHLLGARFSWWDILIEAKEVIRVVMRFDGHQAVPTFLIRLGHAVCLVAAHEVYVDSRLHCRPKLAKKRTGPAHVSGIAGRLRPVGEQV